MKLCYIIEGKNKEREVAKKTKEVAPYFPQKEK